MSTWVRWKKEGEVVFLHKMMDGPADKSYGIHVAKIAGLPPKLLERAAKILETLEAGDTIHHSVAVEVEAASSKEISYPEADTLQEEPAETQQLSLFSELSESETAVITALKTNEPSRNDADGCIESIIRTKNNYRKKALRWQNSGTIGTISQSDRSW